ncbi:uncharacterized protein LOC123894863 [Trifolium pratense]|uniref:uncharacterized protein LOC123894863 n=1 Tax=Trifolium pratense TaxID=57577 RepID=UPI001E6949CB|nr:uncharacterized protein LOC123894863 [Trifolium pratense]
MVLNNDSVNHHHSSEMSFRITQDGRFFSRLMSKETSNSNSSSRRVFYYGETSVAVPFNWEAQPGTPKHPLSETSLPPLTPPPSYSSTNYKSNGKRRNSKVNMFLTILPRLACSRKSHVSLSSSSSLWSSSSSSSSLSSFSTRDGRLSRSPHSSISLKTKFSNGFKGCYPFGSMKNATVSHGL